MSVVRVAFVSSRRRPQLGFGQFLESLREFKAGNLTSQSSTNGNSRHVAPKLSILFLLVWVLCVLFVRAEKRAP